MTVTGIDDDVDRAVVGRGDLFAEAEDVFLDEHLRGGVFRAGMVESVLDYAWSSAKAHVGLATAPKWHGSQDWAARYPTEKWREVLGLGFRPSGGLDRLREGTRTGGPSGSKDFVAELEAKLERNLDPRKPGLQTEAQDRRCFPRESLARWDEQRITRC